MGLMNGVQSDDRIVLPPASGNRFRDIHRAIHVTSPVSIIVACPCHLQHD